MPGLLLFFIFWKALITSLLLLPHLIMLEFYIQFLKFHNLQVFFIQFLVKFANVTAEFIFHHILLRSVINLFICLLAKCYFIFLWNTIVFLHFFTFQYPSGLERSSTPSILLLLISISLNFKYSVFVLFFFSLAVLCTFFFFPPKGLMLSSSCSSCSLLFVFLILSSLVGTAGRVL